MKDSALSFNRELAKELGIPAALLYQELQRKFFYWKSQGKLNDEGMFWCDQGAIAEWILVHPNTVSKAAKDLEEAGLIKKKISYRPGTVTPTTWWGLVISEFTPNVISSNHTKCDFYNKANTKANTDDGLMVKKTNKEEMKVAYLKVNPSGRAWKSKKVYTTASEIERLEEMDDEDYIEFKHWMSPGMVGNDARAKVKRMKVKLVQPDVEEEDTVVHDGKEVKVDRQIYGKVY